MKDKLKELREKRGLSQAAVAAHIGISRQMYNKYENGEVEPSMKAIKALCTLYAVSYDEFLGNPNVTYPFTDEEDVSFAASPSTAYGMYGTTSVLSQIMELLPKLLYSEKAKLLTTIAQSMTNDVEAGKLAARIRPERLNHAEPYIPSYEESAAATKKLREYAESIHFNTHGIQWTREDMHER